MARLWYLALLLLSAWAIVLGIWFFPPLLSLGILFAVPAGGVALLGVVSPAAVRARSRLMLTARWGAYALCFEWIALNGWGLWTQRRTVALTVQSPMPARVRIVFGVEDGSRRQMTSWQRVFDVPSSGLAYTQYAPDRGGYRKDEPHPLRVRIVDARGDTSAGNGLWLRGGYAPNRGCDFQYDEYVVWRSASDAPKAGQPDRVDWLDSLSAWGVDCRRGRLRRLKGAAPPPFPTSSQACYYEMDGSMNCLYRARAP